MGPDLQPIMDSTEIYSGMWANVGVTLFGYNLPTNKGIGMVLDNVMKIRNDEPLGDTRASVEDDFAGLVQPDTAPPVVPPVGAPVPQYTAPAAVPNMGTPYSAPQYTMPASTPPVSAPYTPPNAAPRIDPITGLPW